MSQVLSLRPCRHEGLSGHRVIAKPVCLSFLREGNRKTMIVFTVSHAQVTSVVFCQCSFVVVDF